MFRTLSKEEFLTLAAQNKYVAVYRELLSDTFTPIAAFENLTQKNQAAILLESGIKFNQVGSYSFIGIDPYASFATYNGVTTITVGESSNNATKEPLALLREFHQQFRCAHDPFSGYAESGFLGPMMGFLAYDAVRYFEKIPDAHADSFNCPDILFNFYRTNLIFNHETHKLLIAVIVPTTDNLEQAYTSACQDIDATVLRLQTAQSTTPQISDKPNFDENSFATDCSDAEFAQKVQQVKAYIQAGDAFQVVISRKFYKPSTVEPLSVYRILRYSNPTPYMFYLKTPDFAVFGASPEKLVSMTDREVVITPIAGTIPLSPEDSTESLLEQLRNDTKQCAEHMMLVDLARNDIGAVCEAGSVQVEELMRGQRLTHVMHMVSYVKGRLAKQYDAFDLLKSVFPAGTLSGAPKIRAMELINEIETSKRNLYGGVICKIDVNGNLDSCIIIRSALAKDGVIQVRAGAGIVFDSDPLAEAAETRHKAKGVLTAISMAE